MKNVKIVEVAVYCDAADAAGVVQSLKDWFCGADYALATATPPRARASGRMPARLRDLCKNIFWRNHGKES